MRIKRPFTILAIALGALAVVALLKWGLDRKEVQLRDVFLALDQGEERLANQDVAGARKQFQESIERFEDLGRDPLMALHHAFAAKLRADGAPGFQEVRQFTVPSQAARSRAGEMVLALALSNDSSLLAVTTKQRLLCLLVADGQWAEWELPRPIKRVAALHVDAASGKAHLVTGDDGALLTANCRAQGSPLAVMPSLTDNQPAVAWFDIDPTFLWVAEASPRGAEVKIRGLPATGETAEPVALSVPFPGEANALFSDAAVVHSVARIDGSLLLFYGDADQFHDSDMRDESVLVISVDNPDKQTNRLVFPAHTESDDSGKTRSMSTHVRRVLPASRPGRVYAMTEAPDGVAVLGSDAKTLELHTDALFSADHQDGPEVYDLSLKVAQGGAAMQIAHRGSGTRFSYPLPWKFEDEPRAATMSRDGRQVVVANDAGSILIVDLSSSLAK